ncbi:D-alanyl-D-alanine carboxypeptidase family protein [Caproiciproducens galactitolivorans]|uniref:D-alanyl-D-alanine carboxypeptidase family protein n=1 Tax=Caproiciproducens galactitolivorans TaxID=642589 RepID=UPI001FAA064D|nr:D-alanyl-D-alanine carboxypeptidase family protein [Caproiciproducens galactitolivorans]
MVVLLKKAAITFLIVLFFPFFFSMMAIADTAPLQVSAKSAILINADDGRILYAKNENERRPMASTTKIMTALITLETAAVNNKVVTITDKMVRVEGSSMGLRPGDKLSLRALAEGMLLVSGNDAANSAAIAISGSDQAFAVLMNKRAKELNMTNTHFVTPSGLDDENHYTTAKDLAILAAAAMHNPDFAEIASQKVMAVQFVNPDQTRKLKNHNKLLSMYDGCIGVKTGFTKKSGRCLVSSAQRNGVNLIAVTLNDPDDWKDHQKLLDYGFSKLTGYKIDDSSYAVKIPIVGGGADSVVVHGCKGNDIAVEYSDVSGIKRTVELSSFLYAPVEEGQTVGCIRYTLNTQTLATTDLVAAATVAQEKTDKNIFQKWMEWLKNLF